MFKLTLLFRDKLLQVHHLSEGDTLIGRNPDCGVQIDSLAIAPQHARVTVRGAQITLHDISDGAGVQVNNKIISEQALQDGDYIQLGKHTLKVSRDDSVFSQSAPTTPEPPPAAATPVHIGWLQVLNGPHLGRAFPIEHDPHRIGKPGMPSALITRTDQHYQITTLEGDACQVDGRPLDTTGQPLIDGAIIECGELRMQFFLDQAVSSPAAHKPAPIATGLRHFSRVPFDAQAYLRSDTMVWQCRMIDVSLKGALITRPEDWQGSKGEAYTLELLLGDDQPVIRMTVTVAHAQPERIGLHCDHIDIDSITELRRLIELNLAEPAILERELAALG